MAQLVPLCDGSRLLTPDEVAAMIVIPKQTLFQWRSRGKGPKGYRIGVHLRYKCKDVLDWIEDQGDDWTDS